MANEVTLNLSLAYEDSESADLLLDLAESLATVSVKRFVKAKQAVGTSEEPIGLGDLSGLGWACFINRDSTNYVEIRSASGAANDIIKIPAGKGALFHFGSDVSAPYIIANTEAVQVEYLIVNT